MRFFRFVLCGCSAAALVAAWGGPAAAAQYSCTPTWVTTDTAPPYVKAETANVSALQTCINAASAAGTASLPGLVILQPTGSITTAQITSVNLASNTVIYVSPGFTLLGPSPADVSYTGTGSKTATQILKGGNVTNVTITGTGTIDGNGTGFWAIYNQGGSYTSQGRTKIMEITGSGIHIGANFNLLGQQVPGVTFPNSTNDPTNTLKIQNSPKMHVALNSNDAIVDGVWIRSNPLKGNVGRGNMVNLSPNTDAIDVVGILPINETKGVLIQNSILDVGDDDVAIKSSDAKTPTINTSIRNVVIGGGHGISVGGQESGGVYNIAVENAWFNGTDFGLKVKTDNSISDNGITSNAHYHNVCMQNVGMPIQLTFRYTNQPTSASGVGNPPVISNITYDNVVATNVSFPQPDAVTAGAINLALGDISGTDPSDTNPSANQWVSGAYSTVNLINQNIRLINSKITPASGVTVAPFTIEEGTLMLGSHSSVTTKTGKSAKVITVPDGGPTVHCPTTITIPPQN